MSRIILYTISAALLLSCGGSAELSIDELISQGDLIAIKEERAKLKEEEHDLSLRLKQLDEAVNALDENKNIALISSEVLESKPFEHFLELQGNVMTDDNVVIFPELPGILVDILVKQGQNVQKGQVLARIDDGGIAQQLSQAEIQTQLAKTNFERQERLWNQKIGSEMQYLQAKTSYEAQEQMVDQMKVQLAKAAIKAPFSGVVDEIITEEGNMVNPGQTPILRVVNLNDMYLDVEVPESYLTSVSKGKKAFVEFPILGETVESSIRHAASFVDPANRTFKVQIAVPNNEKRIKPNLTARIRLNDYTSAEAILIPQNVISENAEGDQFVYLLNTLDEKQEGEAVKRIIKTGRSSGNLIEVLEGLKPGDRIIIEGAKSVREGQTVRNQM